ncbi:G-type lectin S-receptor-like serine/threonine-protein kinase LECRK1 [Humulus lupulus]|uniref:G-type lectin S-receptor-like serine/threonine-protein kinase LECRK1 n=1 Tax=Humulus lupulus TaxID=3486 RepID=UPI002B408B2E|nr:G-type lectin S-receptor-like serine/threonine-protein kinase LECRK1 [Humulus lupulus]
MIFLRLLLFIGFVFVTSEAQQRQSNISPESSLKPDGNSSWLSKSGLFGFGFYKQGNGFSVGIFVAGIPLKTVVWTANRDSPPVSKNATLAFTSEGRLVLRSSQGVENIGDPVQSGSSASMMDSGNFVVFNSNKEIIWQSFDHPTDTLLPSQRLLPNHELISSASESNHASGMFKLIMQLDGNLVQYPLKSIPLTPDDSYYNTGTFNSGNNVTLTFDSDHVFLYLMNSTGVNFRNVTNDAYYKKDTIFLMRVDWDGIFRLYSYNLKQSDDNWSTEWSSTNDKCAAKGLCALNGFCIQNDQKASCECLPGFERVNEGNWSSGCEKNFIADSCGNNNRSLNYTMQEIPNTTWEDNSISILSPLDREGCIKACMNDCNCEAAFYDAGNCKKQALPLRQGRRSSESSNIAFIKVYTSQITTEVFVSKKILKKVRSDILITSVFLASFGLIILVISLIALYKSRFWEYKKITTRSDDIESIGDEVSLRSFTYEELERFTDCFKEEIGKGSFGTVYKGIISSSQKLVAVKRLDKVLEEGEREFQNEMKAIGRTHHKNLVRLLGYCHEGRNRLLVYEYMSNGSLADILFKPENNPRWEERLQITCEIARGVLYLHEECVTQTIHCDIKPQNILMDENRSAKISDFGLAKLLNPDQTRTFTGIRGTRGYVAPEWHRRLPITAKADVYSFGIVLLEIICCRRNVMWDLPEKEAVLEEWVYTCFENGELVNLVESEEIDKRELERMVKVALWCIQEDPSLRPSMKKVLLMLEGTVDIPIPPSPEFF